MHDVAVRVTGLAVRVAEDVREEFERRLADSSALAVRVAYSVVRNQADADDVAQEAFVRAYQRFDRLRDREKFRSWLVRMTFRLALDHRRAARRRAAREDAAAVPDASPGSQERVLLDAERRTRLWEAIDALPERLRLVVVLAAIQEHGLAEVASILSVPEGTVKYRMFEARQRLQELLR